jgi:hypothetical protein
MINSEYIPDKPLFSPLDIKSRIFNVFVNNAWSKAFRKDFLLDNNLVFDTELRRAQDALFTNMALVSAKTLKFVDEVLVKYRVHDSASWLTINRYPLCGLWYLQKLRHFLQKNKLLKTYEKSFDNQCAEDMSYSLEHLSVFPEFNEAFLTAKKMIAEYGLDKRPREYFYRETNYDFIEAVIGKEKNGYLFFLSKRLHTWGQWLTDDSDRCRRELEITRSELNKTQDNLNALVKSHSWRMTKPLRTFVGWWRH